MLRMGIIRVAVAALALASASLSAARAGYDEAMAAAGDAFNDGDWVRLNEALDAAQSERPWSLYVWKNRILARVLAGRVDEALDLARIIAERGLFMEISGHDALNTLAALPEFTPIAERMARNREPIGEVDIYAEGDDNTLLPEAITFDGRDLYIGSVRSGRILKRSGDSDFTGFAFAQGGVFDLEVRDDAVWAAVNNQLAFEKAGSEDAYAAIVKFDARSGAVISETRLPAPAIFGDIEAASDGAIYISDSAEPHLRILRPGGDAIESFVTDDRFVNLQGIALDEGNGKLFVADYLAGLFTVDLETREVTRLENAAGAHLGGVDGLYLARGDLIAIQNGVRPHRVMRFELDESGQSVIGAAVLQQGLAEWNEPTHGAMRGGRLYYIGASNWPAYGEDNAIDEAALKPLRIMRVRARR